MAQTYLEAFTNNDGMLIPYYKGKHVVLGNPKTPKAICFEIDGDTNKYFNDPRTLDSYLPLFENPWVQNVISLRDHFLDGMAKYQISGYVAFLRSCTPAAKRLGQERIRAAIQPTIEKVSERQFKQHPPKDEDTRKIIKTALMNKQITSKIERQFPHALGINSLVSVTARFFYGKWLIMINKSNHPFITSDNPAVAYYHGNDDTIAQIYVPIAPDIAILITADSHKSVIDKSDITNISLNDCFAVPKDNYIEKFNKLIIRAAEERVFHRCVDLQLEQMVLQNSNWHLEIVVDNITTRRGTLVITRELTRQSKRS